MIEKESKHVPKLLKKSKRLFEDLPERDEKYLREWINYLEQLHPRIRVQSILDENFDSQSYLKSVTQYLDEKSKHIGLSGKLFLPKGTHILAIASYDITTLETTSEYSIENSVAFCVHKKAFYVRWKENFIDVIPPLRFSPNKMYTRRAPYNFNALEYSPVLYSWSHILRQFKYRLGTFVKNNSIPKLPDDLKLDKK